MNIVFLSGNVGKDPVIKTLEGGKKVASFTLATTYGYGEKAKTEWHNIKVWEKLAEIAEKYVKKGSKINVVGRINSDSYTDKDGNKKNFTEIVCNEIELLGKKEADSDNPPTPRNETPTTDESGDPRHFSI